MKQTIWKIALASLLVVGSVKAATVVGDLHENTFGAPLTGWVVFNPDSTPLGIGNQTYLDVSRKTRAVDGFFTATNLVGGFYWVSFDPPASRKILIFVPVNSTNVYQFNQVSDINLIMGSGTSNYITITFGTNIALQAGDSSVVIITNQITPSNFLYSITAPGTNGGGAATNVFIIEGGNNTIVITNSSGSWTIPTAFIKRVNGEGTNTTLYGNITFPTGATNGYVWVSDSAGIGHWGDPASSITTINSLSYLTNLVTRTFSISAFGANGDGQIATNVTTIGGSRTVTMIGGTFVPSDVGKIISIYGAGVAGLNHTTIITNVANVNTITISNAAVLTVSGNSAVYGTDQTTVIQDAISYVATNGGGTIRVPGGIYIINGPLQDVGTNSLHHNSQIICPSVQKIGNLCPTIRIIGQQAAWARGLSTVRSNEFVSYGSCFWSTLPTGPNVNPGRVIDFRDFSNPAAVGFCNNGDILPLGNVNVEVRDMIWRAAFDNNMTLLDLQGTDGSIVERCIIDTGWHQGNTAPVPTQTNGFGLKTAGSFNENLCRLDQTMVRNFYNGVDLGENGVCPYVLIEGCVNAFNFTSVSGGASRWIGMANVQECTNVFIMGPCAASVYVDFLSVYNQERYTGGNMNSLVDPVSALIGKITYRHSSAGLADDARLNVVGGLGVSLLHTMLGLGELRETRMLVDTNIFGHRLFLYGQANPGINWTTNILTFADSPKYVAYLNGANSAWILEHTQSGQNVIINDGQDNMTLGVAGKTFTVNPLVGSGTALVLANASGGLIRSSSIDTNIYWGTNATLGGLTNTAGAVHIVQGNLEVKNSLIVTNEAFFGINQATITSDGHFQSNPGQPLIGDCFVAGDTSNSAKAGADYAVIGGGRLNIIGTNGSDNVIAGGSQNTFDGAILAGVTTSVISGGGQNTMRRPLMGLPQHANVISGGWGNIMNTNVIRSVIIGGSSNKVGDGSAPITNAVVLGGSNNAAMASFTIVAGNRAQTTNAGAMVFADSQEADFFSTTNNQFNIRAAGGLRLVGNETVFGDLTATNAIFANNYFYSTNFARIKQQFSACNVIGISGVWSVGGYGAEPFNDDATWHLASTTEPLSFHVPAYATNMTVTYWAAATSARAWTNNWRQHIYDTGTRDFGAVLADYPVVVTSSTPVYQSNSVPIVAGKTNSIMRLDYYKTATNTANNYYFIGPVSVLFE